MMPNNYTEIDLFNGESVLDYFKSIIEKIETEVNSTSKSILQTDSELVSSLVDKYSIAPLSVNTADRKVEIIGEEEVEKRDEFGDPYTQTLKRILVSYGFDGQGHLFSLQPSIRTLNSYDRSSKFLVSSVNKRIGYELKTATLDHVKFENDINEHFRRLFSRLPDIKNDVSSFNNKLKSTIESLITNRVNKLTQEEDFLQKVNRPTK